MFQSILFFFFFLGYLVAPIQCHPQHSIVLRCLKHYRPSLAVLFTCWTPQDKIRLHRLILAEVKVRLVFLKVEEGVVAQINSKNYGKLTYFLDMQCANAENVLREASGLDRFGHFQFIYSWYLLVGAERNLTEVLGMFKTFKTRMDMDVKVFQGREEDSEIWEIFNPGLNKGPTMRHIGKYKENLISMERNVSYYESRKNMTGVLVRSASVVKHPFKTSFEEYMQDPKQMMHDIYSKFHFQLFQGLVYIHGFTYNITLASSWFGNASNGKDGGFTKMLWEDTIDISSAGGMLILLDSDRVFFYDYIMPYYRFRSCFYFRNPGVVTPNFQEVLKPFARQTWIVTLYVAGLVCLCIEISYLVEERRLGLRSFFVVIAVFSQQGLDRTPCNIPGRIIFLHLLVCSLLLYNYYTSSLVSSLINTEPEVLKTIQELQESNLKVGFEHQPYFITYMLDRVKTNHYLDLLNKTKMYENGVPNILGSEEGIAKVKRGGFAYHVESITAYPIIADTFEQDAICDLAQIVLIQSDCSLLAQKKSQYKKLFQISLRKMWQSGIIRKLHKTWVKSKPECFSGARLITVTINDLFMPYFLLAMGVLVSLGVLVAETFWMRIKSAFRRCFFVFRYYTISFSE